MCKCKKFDHKFLSIRAYIKNLSFNKQGLPLGDKLTQEGITAKCGMFVVDLKRDYAIIHSITFQTPIDELYDICAIPGVTRPKLSDIGDDANMREFLIDYGDVKVK